MTLRVVGGVIVAFCGLLFQLSMPGSVCAAGPCPDLPSGGGQTMSATAKTTATSCPVADGMYVRAYITTLRLDAIATASGQCQLVFPDDWGVCVPSAYIQERTINHIYSWVDITSQYINGTYDVGNVFNAIGFDHVLDTTQPSSTGPMNFGIGSPGDYFLHFQANINMTACNILPATTPTVDIMVHARSALHRGQRTNGTLVGGTSLPDSGPGFYHPYAIGELLDSDDWGGAEAAISLIQTVGAQWFQSHPIPRMGIVDISRENGGPFPPHGEHQNGLDIDIRYVRKSGIEGPLDLAVKSQKKNWYDRALTIELMRKFAANGSLSRILVSPLSEISSADVPGVNIVQVSGHDNHFHVSLVDPDGLDSNNCP
ncbi:MAG TPA: penicillin-insensitive murein endopeptidase [Nitrospiraceae bacterium]|nr:penicillin-insensitive murein endopeptidase [Nitrospiraceae bacterium]